MEEHEPTPETPAAEAPPQGSLPQWPLPQWPLPQWLAPLALAISIAAGYAAASWPNAFLYDDFEVILAQESPQGLDDVGRYFGERHFPGLAYYRPVTRTTLLAQKSLHGEDPLPFHLFNAALAGLAFLASFAVLRRPRLEIARAPALAAAALFALHPAASSCVYPAASGRETLLPAVLSLAALWAFLQDGRRWTLATVGLTAAALFGKEQAVMLLPLFALAEILSLAERNEGTARLRLLRWLGIGAATAVYLGIRFALFGGEELRFAVLEKPLGPLESLAYSVQATFAPFWALVYEPPLEVWLSPPRLALGAIALATLGWAAWRLGVGRAAVLFLGAWFVLTQLPTANLIVQEAPFSERYVFLAVFAVAGLGAAALSRLVGRARQAAFAAALVLVALAAVVSFHRANYFRDPITFHHQWVATNPASPVAHMGLAAALAEQNRDEEAIASFRRAVELRPHYAEAHFNLGNTLAGAGRRAEAVEAYENALAAKPELLQAYLNLGEVHLLEGRPRDALGAFRRGAERAPDDPRPLASMGEAFARTGEAPRALAHFADALGKAPEDASLHRRFGGVLADLGRAEQAVGEYRESLRLEPQDAETHYGLGLALLGAGRAEEAAASFREALEFDPDYAEAHTNLGAVLGGQGRLEEALEHYREAVRLKPEHAPARLNLGVALLLGGELEEALEHLEAGARSGPDEPRAHLILGQALIRAGRHAEAAASLGNALALAPEWPEPMTALATLLAASPSDAVRDGAEAVRLAEAACHLTGYRQIDALNALAASYAEAGNAERAIEVAREVVRRLEASGQAGAARALGARVELYRAGKPLRLGSGG